jgi:hypothetical protein
MLFALGQTVATPGALELMARCEVEPQALLHRHSTGDFGTAGHYNDILPDLTPEELTHGVLATSDDGKLNALAIKFGEGRVCSYYPIQDNSRKQVWKVWVITYLGEGGYTTLLLPEEY